MVREQFNTLTATRFGQMLLNKNDVYIGQSLSHYGEYSWFEIELLEQFIQDGCVVIEAGANIGSHTVPLSQRAGSNGELHVFEPQRLVFQTLCANLAINSCDNVHAHWSGVGQEKGSITVPDLSPYLQNNFGGVKADSQQGIERPLVSIDSLQLSRCDLIKADIEGMEIALFKGAKETVMQYRPVLYFEIEKKETAPELLEYIFELGYSCWWHTPNLFNPNNFFSRKEDIFNVISLNVLALPKESAIKVELLKPIDSVNSWYQD